MKSILWILMGAGATIGGIIPLWFGAGYFSFWELLGSVVGAVAGIYLYRYLDL